MTEPRSMGLGKDLAMGRRDRRATWQGAQIGRRGSSQASTALTDLCALISSSSVLRGITVPAWGIVGLPQGWNELVDEK